MAEGESGEKTEAPSGKRLSDARSKGQVAVSREVNTWFVLMGGAVVVLMVAPPLMGRMALGLRWFLASPDQIATDQGSIGRVLLDAFTTIGLIVAIPLGVLMIAGLAGPLIQAGWVISAEPLMPSLDRLSPMAGFKRIFSVRSVIELGKSTVKMLVMGAVMVAMLMPVAPGIEHFVGLDPVTMLGELRRLSFRVIGGALGVVTLVAGADYAYQRFDFMQKMRMTKQEVKEEYKDTEGDPVIRGRLRQMRMEKARRRMMAAVPTATVVVTNPTHFAVAMKYEPEQPGAPVVVAKGADLVALAIRRLATENGVTIVENPPLARALFAAVEIDQEIPEEHYKAVAEVISYVFRLKGKAVQR